jgi:2,4-dienoyl-CoA reductase-like NADH-dependent reductase (Old Yellow Enzyme family)
MSRHERFAFATGNDLLRKAEELSIRLPFHKSVAPLFRVISIGSKTIPNRLVVQPMEGFDANPDGSPGERTFRRYQRYASGGSGIIWFEATSVVQEGRSNPRQLMINSDTLDGFRRLVEQTRQTASQTFGNSKVPLLVLQLTHSGRYSKPEGKSHPQVTCFNPHLDKNDSDIIVLNDDGLDRLRDTFLDAIGLAHEAGFDCVDIKACHGYLVHDLLSTYTRTNSKYGGSFENRTRFLLDVIREAHKDFPEILLAVRLNATDGIPHPYGFGVCEDGSLNVDLTEPKKLMRLLISEGCAFFNITAGIAAVNPQIGRPFDLPLRGQDLPEEHPMEGVARQIRLTEELQEAFPKTPMVGTGYSWLRQFFPYVGAAVVEREMASFIGLGRSSFAYPDAPRDLMEKGWLNPKKVCITCSQCTELMRHGHVTGCVMRDKEIYGKEYKKIS